MQYIKIIEWQGSNSICLTACRTLLKFTVKLQIEVRVILFTNADFRLTPITYVSTVSVHGLLHSLNSLVLMSC